MHPYAPIWQLHTHPKVTCEVVSKFGTLKEALAYKFPHWNCYSGGTPVSSFWGKLYALSPCHFLQICSLWPSVPWCEDMWSWHCLTQSFQNYINSNSWRFANYGAIDSSGLGPWSSWYGRKGPVSLNADGRKQEWRSVVRLTLKSSNTQNVYRLYKDLRVALATAIWVNLRRGTLKRYSVAKRT